ncbi:MAG: TetR/AcrR family transcriptional regulator [Nitrospirae bacterium]|nr:TetR/AcrR family transcriptional regulator [Nitrospirota bacterium]
MIHVNKRSGMESKKKILVAATKVFSDYGYKGASMRMIAGAAGISIGGLYLYFKNKEDLYGTLIRNRLDDLTEETRETLRDIQDPAEAMSTFISMRVKYARKHRELILVLGKEQAITFGLKAKRKFFEDQRRVIEEIVRKGITSGRFRSCDESEVAKIIICALRGFILSMIVEPDALFSHEECSNLILKGILAKK